jgi:hypothetical protein
MCDNALLIGFATSCKKIDEAIMFEVIRDMDSALFHDAPLPAYQPDPVEAGLYRFPDVGSLPPPVARRRSALQRLLACVSARRRQ